MCYRCKSKYVLYSQTEHKEAIHLTTDRSVREANDKWTNLMAAKTEQHLHEMQFAREVFIEARVSPVFSM